MWLLCAKVDLLAGATTWRRDYSFGPKNQSAFPLASIHSSPLDLQTSEERDRVKQSDKESLMDRQDSIIALEFSLSEFKKWF